MLYYFRVWLQLCIESLNFWLAGVRSYTFSYLQIKYILFARENTACKQAKTTKKLGKLYTGNPENFAWQRAMQFGNNIASHNMTGRIRSGEKYRFFEPKFQYSVVPLYTFCWLIISLKAARGEEKTALTQLCHTYYTTPRCQWHRGARLSGVRDK